MNNQRDLSMNTYDSLGNNLAFEQQDAKRYLMIACFFRRQTTKDNKDRIPDCYILDDMNISDFQQSIIVREKTLKSFAMRCAIMGLSAVDIAFMTSKKDVEVFTKLMRERDGRK